MLSPRVAFPIPLKPVRPNPRRIAALLLSMLAVQEHAAVWANDAEQSFDQGVALTRSGDYAGALPHFLRAQASGDDSARLAYNLGVVYYRLARHAEATRAFERATQDAELRDLAQYNLGLVAMASGDRERAERWFRLTAKQASALALRSLAVRALSEGLGLAAPAMPRAARGSLAVLRGEDRNVLIPVGAISDLPSSQRDHFWEARAGWSDTLSRVQPALRYRLAGLAIEYDEIGDADIALAEAGIDWRGPIGLEAAVGMQWVGDRSYQSSLDLRAQLPLWKSEHTRVALDGQYTGVEPGSERARDLQGSQQGLGFTADAIGAAWALTLAYRYLDNDRRAAALSPQQQRVSLRLRSRLGPWTARVWTRYTDSDYPTGRNDEATEFGADLGLRLDGRWEWLVEATRMDNRSNRGGHAYDADRFCAGLRFRYD